MYANFLLTATASSSLSAHRRRLLLLLIVLIVVLAKGMECMSSTDQSPSTSRKNKKNAGAVGDDPPRAVSELPHVDLGDLKLWSLCAKHCKQYNDNPDQCASTINIICIENKQCRCKMSQYNTRHCIPYSYDEPKPDKDISGY
ncbi:hypothetical protein niasHT_040031 [Heterodera trifolii]|uniref:Effector protein n=1 Tax=Heterodera trifolii TaxID=157864 RepID=A0ABD2J2B7_9BILA